MYIVRGSHKSGHIPHDLTNPGNPFVKDTDFDIKNKKLVELNAGSGLLFDMFLLHQSVPNVSKRIKFVLVLTIQDLLNMANPDDPNDRIGKFFHIHKDRTKARQDNISSSKKATC